MATILARPKSIDNSLNWTNVGNVGMKLYEIHKDYFLEFEFCVDGVVYTEWSEEFERLVIWASMTTSSEK